MKALFLLLVFFSLLFSASDSEIIKRANNLSNSSKSSDLFRAYNDYKNVFLRAIINDNDKLKTKSLKGIVKSGKKLHIDISKYANELRSMKKTTNNVPKIINKKVQDIKVVQVNKLKQIFWSGSRLVLKFEKKIFLGHINYFKLEDAKKKRFRYIFDIHASMQMKNHSLRHKDIKRIKLGQFKRNILRLVFENSKKLKVRFKLEDNKLIINMGVSPVKVVKSFEKFVPSIPQNTVYKPSSKIIVVDAGHGGKDPGAIGYKKYREKIVVMQIAKKLRYMLKKRGYRVHLTRSNDKFIKLKHRTSFANKKNADIFVSIHANSVPRKSSKKAYGIETFFLSPSRSSRASKVAAKENSKYISDMKYYNKNEYLSLLNRGRIVQSHKLAIDIQRGVLGSLRTRYSNVKDSGVREGPFWVLVGAQMPSILVEVGFISNPAEAKRLVNSNYQNLFADGLADGIDNYFLHN